MIKVIHFEVSEIEPSVKYQDEEQTSLKDEEKSSLK